MWKHVRNIILIVIVMALAGIWYITRPDVAKLPLDAVTGPSPEITAPRPEIFPTIKVADVDRWKAGEAPVAAPGLIVERFAEASTIPAICTRCPMATFWLPRQIRHRATLAALKAL